MYNDLQCTNWKGNVRGGTAVGQNPVSSFKGNVLWKMVTHNTRRTMDKHRVTITVCFDMCQLQNFVTDRILHADRCLF